MIGNRTESQNEWILLYVLLLIILCNRMSSTKPYHFRSGEKNPKPVYGLPRRSTDREQLGQPIRFTADSQYYNRRVHTQNNDDDCEFGKPGHRLGFGTYTSNQKLFNNLKKTEKDYRKYQSLFGQQKQKRNQGVTIQVPKTGMMIAANNLHQNISIFSEMKPKKEPSKVLVTEVGAKITSKDKVSNKESKRLFDRLLLTKDKVVKNQIGQSSKSKEAREKFISGNFKEKAFFANKENEDTGERMTFKQNKPTGMRETIKQIKQKLLLQHPDHSTAREPKNLKTEPCQISKPQIQMLEKVGQGTFGEVFKAKLGNKIVAVKKVYQDKKYKNRQLEILGMIKNDFVLNVIDTFHSQQKGKKGEAPKDYLNVVMEYYEQNLFEANLETQEPLTSVELKLFMYQLFRGLMYIHSLDICHRDIKPQNVLVNRKKGKLVICDFGSAKKLIKGETNIAYICSRCYRAPELIFGCTNYTTMIDIWSAGCVLLELLTGEPFFIGDSNIGQLVEIIKTLGTPSKTEVVNMNPSYDLDDYKFPKIKTKPWREIFPKIDQDLESLLKQLMIYSPKQRLNAGEALCHQYFDQLREESTYQYLREKKQIKPLFDFTKEQLKGNEHLTSKLVPDWYENRFYEDF